MTAIKFERLQLFRFYVPIFALFESDDLESTTRLIFHIPCLSKTSKISFTQNYLQRFIKHIFVNRKLHTFPSRKKDNN